MQHDAQLLVLVIQYEMTVVESSTNGRGNLNEVERSIAVTLIDHTVRLLRAEGRRHSFEYHPPSA